MTSILAPEPICVAVYAIVVMFLAAIGINAAVDGSRREACGGRSSPQCTASPVVGAGA